MNARNVESAASKMFHKNVHMMTQVISPSKEFKKHFKERMFDKPNTEGFIHVSYYLLNIYNEEYFKKNIDWPLFDKRSEAKYRKDVKDFMAIVADENNDLEFPQILASHLITAGGKKFITLMYKLSTATLRMFLKHNGKVYFSKPKRTHPIAKVLFKYTIAKDTALLNKRIDEVSRVQAEVKGFAKKIVVSIEQMQKNILEERQKLSDFVANFKYSNDMKRRLLDTNDSVIIEEWNTDLNIKIQQLEKKLICVEEIRKQSSQVDSLVKSLYADGQKILDGKNLPVINTEKLVELLLDPQIQVAVENLYVDNKLSLNNMFCILSSILNYYQVNSRLLELPYLQEFNQQLAVSTDDLKVMISAIDTTKEKAIKLLTETNKMIDSAQLTEHSMHLRLDDTIFNSNVLQESPVINLKHCDIKSDVLESLQLTPVDYPQKELLTRYVQHNDYIRSNALSERPKLVVTRINFDDTLQSTSKDEMLNISQRSVSSKSSQSLEASVGSRMANLIKFKRGALSNLMTLSNQWRTSTLVDENRSGSIYDQRANISSTSLSNHSLELTPPRGASSQGVSLSEKSFGIKNIGMPNFNSTVSDLKAIVESTETTITNDFEVLQKNNVEMSNELEKSRKIEDNNNIETMNNIETSDIGQEVNKKKKHKEQSNRRHSLSDLVERFKKIREQSTRLPDFSSLDFEINKE